MAKDVNELTWGNDKTIISPVKVVDLRQFKESRVDSEDLHKLASNVRTYGELILWLEHAIYEWNRMPHINKLGESKMDIRTAIRKIIRKQINEELAKYKKENMPKPKVNRELSKEEKDSVLNTQAKQQDEKFKKEKKTGVPTDKEWKRLRNAEEPEASPSLEEIAIAAEALMEKIGKELEEMKTLAEKLGDKVICNALDEVQKTHVENMSENRQRYKFIRLQNSIRPIAARLKSLSDFGDKSKKSDVDKLNKLVEKYLRVEVKKKFDTETDAIEDHEKEQEKLVK